MYEDLDVALENREDPEDCSNSMRIFNVISARCSQYDPSTLANRGFRLKRFLPMLFAEIVRYHDGLGPLLDLPGFRSLSVAQIGTLLDEMPTELPFMNDPMLVFDKRLDEINPDLASCRGSMKTDITLIADTGESLDMDMYIYCRYEDGKLPRTRSSYHGDARYPMFRRSVCFSNLSKPRHFAVDDECASCLFIDGAAVDIISRHSTAPPSAPTRTTPPAVRPRRRWRRRQRVQQRRPTIKPPSTSSKSATCTCRSAGNARTADARSSPLGRVRTASPPLPHPRCSSCSSGSTRASKRRPSARAPPRTRRTASAATSAATGTAGAPASSTMTAQAPSPAGG